MAMQVDGSNLPETRHGTSEGPRRSAAEREAGHGDPGAEAPQLQESPPVQPSIDRDHMRS
jgi:hypothetical protein